MSKQNQNNDLKESFEAIIDTLSLIKMQMTDLQQQIKTIEKKVKIEVKQSKKKSKSANTNKVPSGFAKPIHITNELCEFMNKPIGTEMARTEVTKKLVDYIKTNQLQKIGKVSTIIPDEKLQNLLGIPNEDIPDLTFFTMQKYMNKHFVSSKNKKEYLNENVSECIDN